MVKEIPPKDSLEKFWKEIWGEKKACNMSASWIGNMEKGNEKVKEQEWENITVHLFLYKELKQPPRKSLIC